MHPKRFGWYEIDDALVVADAASGGAMFLNPSASIIWLALTETPHSETALAALLARYFPHPENGRIAGVSPLLGEWERKGWCRQAADGRWELNPAPTTTGGATGSQIAYPEWPAHDARLIWSRQVRLDHEAAAIEIWAGSATHSHEDIVRLQGFLSGLPEASSPARSRFGLWLQPSKCLLFLDGQDRTTADVAEATGYLFHAMTERAFPGGRDHMTLHAGAVGSAKGALIMPAVSGSGKTTLTAYLVARGWSYGGDDIVGLARARDPEGGFRLVPLPSALGVKAGSWSLLDPYFHELRDIPIVSYRDKRVRYLPIPVARHIASDPGRRRPRALVFPRYVTGSQCVLSGMSEGEALRSILAAGSGANSLLDLDAFATLIELVRSTPRYSLHYHRLEEAEQQLAQLP